jgi:hypothetical protein
MNRGAKVLIFRHITNASHAIVEKIHQVKLLLLNSRLDNKCQHGARLLDSGHQKKAC